MKANEELSYTGVGVGAEQRAAVKGKLWAACMGK